MPEEPKPVVEKREVEGRSVAWLVLACVVAAGFRFWFDAAPMVIATTAISVGLLGAVFLADGAISLLIGVLDLVGADYFLVPPIFQLGIDTWTGVIRFGFFSCFLVVFSTLLIRQARKSTVSAGSS